LGYVLGDLSQTHLVTLINWLYFQCFCPELGSELSSKFLVESYQGTQFSLSLVSEELLD
jgi:hypothetical protein